MKVQDVTAVLEEFAPLGLQESYDNAGLLAGDPQMTVTGALCTIDVTQEVLDEALKLRANLIIAHHPLIFGSLKSLTGKNETERLLITAIKNNLAIYAAHTNLDNIIQGVNDTIGRKLGLQKLEILSPMSKTLYKLVTFVPDEQASSVREALFSVGAGHIGNYDQCSYNLSGEGTFRAGENTDPFVGEKGKMHNEQEIRIETIVPAHALSNTLRALLKAHPYEEVAYDIYPLENEYPAAGAGMLGELPEPMRHQEFLELLKQTFAIPLIRYAGKEKKEYRRIALCGGAGSFLIPNAIRASADVFLTSDIKYHQFFDAGDKLLICDIGHYESEQFTKEIFYSLLTKKFSTFAVHLSSIVTNPIKYFV